MQAALYHARKRLRSFLVPDLHKTHLIAESASLDTGALFPVRAIPITLHAKIRITGAPEGLVFEFGGSTRGMALWLETDKIGFHAGVSGTASGADAIYDHGGTLPTGLTADLVAAAIPGNGQVRLWMNGHEIARGAASNGTFSATWGTNNGGSFAQAVNSTTVGIVPIGSQVAPTNFDVISNLSVYVGSVPRHF